MISDLILGLIAFYLFYKHRHLNRYWSLFFLFMGASAMAGGIYHGYERLGESLRFFSWSLLCAAIIFAQLAAYRQQNNSILKAVLVFKSVVFLYLAIQQADFAFMIYDTAISMLGFIAIGNWFFQKPMSSTISYGILISVASAVVVAFKFNLHPKYLSPNDIGHYISIVSLLVMSKGIEKDSLTELAHSAKVLQ